MISKETFVDIMERLEALDSKMDAVDTAFKQLSPDFCGFYITESFDIVTGLLEEIFHDKHGLLGYFMYELDFLRNYKDGSVEVDGEPIDLSTWDKVYDHLVELINEEA